MKGQVAADTNCNKENSNSILGKIFHSGVVKYWIEGGGTTEKL